jgi:hypothetical protein
LSKKARKPEIADAGLEKKQSKQLAPTGAKANAMNKQPLKHSALPSDSEKNRDSLHGRLNAPELIGRQGSARNVRDSQSSQLTDLGDVASKLLNLKTYSRRESSPLRSNKRKRSDDSSDGEWEGESGPKGVPLESRMSKRSSGTPQPAAKDASKLRAVPVVSGGSKSWFEAELNIGVDEESPWASRRPARIKNSVESGAIPSTHTPFPAAKPPSLNISDDGVVPQSQSSPSW